MVVFSFYIVSSTTFFTRDFFKAPVLSTDSTFLVVKWQPLFFFGFSAIWWDGITDYAPGT